MSGLGGVSGRPGEPVIKLSSRHVVKSSSPSSRRHWLFGEACKVGEVGSKSPCSKSPGLQFPTSPNHQISTLCLQVCKYPNLHSNLSSHPHWLFCEVCKVWEVGSKSPCSPSLYVSKSPSFHVRSPVCKNQGLHVCTSQVCKSPCLQVCRSQVCRFALAAGAWFRR